MGVAHSQVKIKSNPVKWTPVIMQIMWPRLLGLCFLKV